MPKDTGEASWAWIDIAEKHSKTINKYFAFIAVKRLVKQLIVRVAIWKGLIEEDSNSVRSS